jgi:hypothetical protein
MGRGRAKAKQTKVARELKYGGPDMDLDRLAAELGADRKPSHDPFSDDVPDEEKYSAWIDEEDEGAGDDEIVEVDDER